MGGWGTGDQEKLLEQIKPCHPERPHLGRVLVQQYLMIYVQLIWVLYKWVFFQDPLGSPCRAKVSAGHCGWGMLQEEEVQSQHTFWKSLQCCEYVLLVDSVFPEVKSSTKLASASTFFLRLSSKFWAINLKNLQWSWWFILLLPCVQFSIGHQCGENSLHLKYSFREKKRKVFWLPIHCVCFSLAIDQRMCTWTQSVLQT